MNTVSFWVDRVYQFVPWGCVATLEDGRTIEGPCFLVGPVELHRA